MRVFATRPQHQNSAWAEKLSKLDLTVVELPCLEIQAIEDRNRYRHKLLALDEYQCVIAISQNAVKYGFDAIDDVWPQLPTGIRWFAVGARTRAAMLERLSDLSAESEAVLMPESQAVDSESLLALSELQEVEEKKILILRGEGGREHLRSELIARGAMVDYCELYQRINPVEAVSTLHDVGLKAGDVLAFFSGESLQNFYSSLSANAIKIEDNITCIVPGQRVAGIAEDYGFKHVVVAENASEDEMLLAITQCMKNTH